MNHEIRDSSQSRLQSCQWEDGWLFMLPMLKLYELNASLTPASAWREAESRECSRMGSHCQHWLWKEVAKGWQENIKMLNLKSPDCSLLNSVWHKTMRIKSFTLEGLGLNSSLCTTGKCRSPLELYGVNMLGPSWPGCAEQGLRAHGVVSSIR